METPTDQMPKTRYYWNNVNKTYMVNPHPAPTSAAGIAGDALVNALRNLGMTPYTFSEVTGINVAEILNAASGRFPGSEDIAQKIDKELSMDGGYVKLWRNSRGAEAEGEITTSVVRVMKPEPVAPPTVTKVSASTPKEGSTQRETSRKVERIVTTKPPFVIEAGIPMPTQSVMILEDYKPSKKQVATPVISKTTATEEETRIETTVQTPDDQLMHLTIRLLKSKGQPEELVVAAEVKGYLLGKYGVTV